MMTWREFLDWAFRPRNPTMARFNKVMLVIAFIVVILGGLAVYVAHL